MHWPWATVNLLSNWLVSSDLFSRLATVPVWLNTKFFFACPQVKLLLRSAEVYWSRPSENLAQQYLVLQLHFPWLFFIFFTGECKFQRENATFHEKLMIQHIRGRQTDRKTDNMVERRYVSFGWHILEHFSVLNQPIFGEYDRKMMSWHCCALYRGSQGASSSFLTVHFQVNSLSLRLKSRRPFSCSR